MNHRPGAHRARLQCYEKRAAIEAVVGERGRGLAHCHDLGVCRGIVVAQHTILPAPDDHAVMNCNRTNRYLARFCGPARLGDRGFHGFYVRDHQCDGIASTAGTRTLPI